MNTQIRYAAYSLASILIVLTMLLAFPEVKRSSAEARAVAPKGRLDPRTAGMDEWKTETVIFKPSPDGVKTWGWETAWFGGGFPGASCDFHSTVKGWGDMTAYIPKVPGQITAGFIHHWDGGSGPFPCQSRVTNEFVGTVWFDLNEIFSKPPLPKAESATLTFKAISSDGPGGVCKDELRLPGDDWMKGLPGDTLPKTGSLEPAKYLEGCPTEGCSFDVTSIVNNWIKGTEDRYGFAISGLDDIAAIGTDGGKNPDNNAHCTTRYGDFRLSVTYTFPIKKPVIPPQTYPLECRGTEALKIMDFDGPVPFRWVGFNFIRGTGPAGKGLLPGQCSWLDREMRPGEPARLAQPIEDTLVWNKELNSPDSYWTFNVYNAGDQLQATGAERNKKFFLPVLRTNYALAVNRGKASSSSTLAPNVESYVNDGDRTGAGDKVWLDSTLGSFPDYIEIDLDGKKTIDEIDVITRQDNLTSPGEPSLSPPTQFNLYGITFYDVQYWDGSAWMTVPNGHVGRGKFGPSPNDQVWRQFMLATPVVTDKIRIQINGGKDNTYSRVVEVEAWGK